MSKNKKIKKHDTKYKIHPPPQKKKKRKNKQILRSSPFICDLEGAIATTIEIQLLHEIIISKVDGNVFHYKSHFVTTIEIQQLLKFG